MNAKDTPNKKSSKTSMGISQSKLAWISTLLKKAKVATTRRLSTRFIVAEKLVESTRRYRGILIFLIKSPLSTITVNPREVTSEKNVHSTIPNKR